MSSEKSNCPSALKNKRPMPGLAAQIALARSASRDPITTA